MACFSLCLSLILPSYVCVFVTYKHGTQHRHRNAPSQSAPRNQRNNRVSHGTQSEWTIRRKRGKQPTNLIPFLTFRERGDEDDEDDDDEREGWKVNRLFVRSSVRSRTFIYCPLKPISLFLFSLLSFLLLFLFLSFPSFLPFFLLSTVLAHPHIHSSPPPLNHH